MSIQTEINRIVQLRDEQTTLLNTQGVTINDIKLALQNKCTGTDPILQEKTITPTTSTQNITPDSGYDGLGKVVVNAVTSSIDSDIKAENIKKGVNILGVTGNLEATEDLDSELSTQDTYLSSQESTIQAIITALQGKIAGGGEEFIDALIQHKVSGSYSNDRITSIGYGTFYNCTSLTSASFPNVTSVSNYAFNGCTNLETINLPEVTSVAGSAFNNTGMVNIYLPKMTSMGTYAFGNSTKHKTINLPKLTIVQSNGFANNSGVEEIDLGVCTNIYATAFSGCSSLTKLILRATSVCTLKATSAFNNTPIASGTGYVYVTDSLVDSYKSASNWSSFSNQIKGISELGE